MSQQPVSQMSEIAGLPLLPLTVELETPAVLKAATTAHRVLAELKGTAGQIPNSAILIDTLVLREAKESSAIENIVTTHDELFKAGLFAESSINAATKEVGRYAAAVKRGFAAVQREGFIRRDLIREVQQELVGNSAGFRKQAGTMLRNERTGRVVFEPPQNPDDVLALLDNLVSFMHAQDDLDPLVKMALLHHQFETVHPFYDGNGRAGRILNVLYLVKEQLLNLPILYLSRYIIGTKDKYYALLQSTRTSREYEPWLLYMLKGVEETSRRALVVVTGIRELMQKTKHRMRSELPKIYSQELLSNLFVHPYTKIDFVCRDLDVTRVTASKYLEQLVAARFVSKNKVGRDNYYINAPLVALLVQDSDEMTPTSTFPASTSPSK